MRDNTSHPLGSSSIGGRVRSRNNIETELPRSIDSSDPSLDLMAEVKSPRPFDVTEAEFAAGYRGGGASIGGPCLGNGARIVARWELMRE